MAIIKLPDDLCDECQHKREWHADKGIPKCNYMDIPEMSPVLIPGEKVRPWKLCYCWYFREPGIKTGSDRLPVKASE